MDTNTIIQTRELCKSYQLGKETIPVLHGISMNVPRGDYCAIMGHSGAGKSTLLNILGCLDTPTSGEYILNGVAVAKLTPGKLADVRNRDIGFVFQNFNLLPKLNLMGNVELPLIYAGMAKRQRQERVEAILKRMGIWERRHHRPSEISGGQKQRVAIARALVKQPALILADEPTGNLDSHTTADILNLLDELHHEGNTILLITHENFVAARAKRVIHLVDGRFKDQA